MKPWPGAFGNDWPGARTSRRRRCSAALVRLGPERSDEALKETHVSEFKITGRGTMKGWVVVSLEGVQNDDPLKGWIQRALKFVGKLPAKEKET